MAKELRCPYCDKFCSSKSGLTNHQKQCKPVGARTSESRVGFEASDPRDIDPGRSGRLGMPTEPAERVIRYESKPSRTPVAPKPKASNGLFDIGAFLILGEHVPLLLDLNFASALADHILKHGSENKAILAFGHQLAKVSGDD